MGNFVNLLRKITKRPQVLDPGFLKADSRPTQEDLDSLKKIGAMINADEALADSTQISYERMEIYKEIDRAQMHWMVSSALELYADYATSYNRIHEATVWVTSETTKYENNLNAMLEEIGAEENVFDWTWTTATYGDLFVQIEAEPGAGIYAVNDDDHPINISRLDNKGLLVGYYRTPIGATGTEGKDSHKLLPPWEYVHFRLLGCKKRRPVYGDPMFAEFRTIHILSPETRRLTSKYGNSLILNSLPAYKRLRLAEDSLLLARTTRGVLKYIYKIAVDKDMTNVDAVRAIVEQYATTLKRARAFDTRASSPNYDSKFNPMSGVEDLFIPVWGDVNSLQIDAVGGDPNIKWIVDIEELRNQLACALRTPLSLLGGFVEEASGALGSDSIEKLDIRFARNARRLQRAVVEGFSRMCQVHLAYQGLDPDPKLFTVHMNEASTAEEESIKEALETGVDITQRMFDMLDGLGDDFEVDKLGVLDYLNEKILKLTDFDMRKFVKKARGEGLLSGEEAGAALGSGGLGGALGGEPLPPGYGGGGGKAMEGPFDQFDVPVEETEPEMEGEDGEPLDTEEGPTKRKKEPIAARRKDGTDLKSWLPLNEGVGNGNQSKSDWERRYGNCMVTRVMESDGRKGRTHRKKRKEQQRKQG